MSREKNMQINKYIYSFRYDNTESELCKLESRCIFNKEEKNKFLISEIKAEPSRSAFIKRRLDIISFSKDYPALIADIKSKKIRTDGFKIEYLELKGDTSEYAERLEKLKDIGFCINTFPDYYNPTIIYGICCYEDVWYFGVLIKNNLIWEKHKQKPRSFSNSIDMNIAKALINIAAQSDIDSSILDACCGVGTIMLEGCFAGNNIEGCDNNYKVYRSALENLAHYQYSAKVFYSDIKDIKKRYDAVILDLPYNMYSAATDIEISHIINAAADISNRLVMVSISDLTNLISNIGFKLSDYCIVNKRASNFSRRIWVCEKME